VEERAARSSSTHGSRKEHGEPVSDGYTKGPVTLCKGYSAKEEGIQNLFTERLIYGQSVKDEMTGREVSTVLKEADFGRRRDSSVAGFVRVLPSASRNHQGNMYFLFRPLSWSVRSRFFPWLSMAQEISHHLAGLGSNHDLILTSLSTQIFRES
jgi:hypothetical protein